MKDRERLTDRILAICDEGLADCGSATDDDAILAIETSVWLELETDAECGFMTIDEANLIFLGWRKRYTDERRGNIDTSNVIAIRPETPMTA